MQGSTDSSVLSISASESHKNLKTNLVTIEIDLGYVFQFKFNLRIIQNIEGSHIREVDLQLDDHAF